MITIKRPIYPLNQFVKHFWVYENSGNNTKNDVQTFVVDGCPIILFHYKMPLKCRTGNNEWLSHPQQCVIGQIKNYGEIIESGDEGMVAVVFFPDGLFPILKIPLHELTGKIIDLKDIFGNEIKEINEKVCELKSVDQKISLVEQFLLKKIKIEINSNCKEIRYAIAQMQSNDKISISKLASEINMSKRNFERKFVENVGLTPVFLSRILRFQKAIALIRKNNKHTLTELSYLTGYYDQSHFIRDFRQFYGQSPKEFSSTQNFG